MSAGICALAAVCVLSGCNYNSMIAAVSAAEVPDTSKSHVLMDYATGTILKEKEADLKRPIASVTKLMTSLLILEAIERGELTLEQNITISSNASGMGGSQIFLDAYSEHTAGDLFKAIVVSSANDASVAFAETIAGSESDFVSRMNSRAAELGMTNTNYGNSTGLPAAGAYSTARDVATVTREVIKHPIYFKYSRIWMDEFKHPGGRITEMANTNKLIRFYKGCDFGKTGSTNEAGYCLSASAQRGDLRLIGVVIGAENSTARFGETSGLFDWGFANFECKRLLDISKPVEQTLKVSKSGVDSIKVLPASDYSILSRKGEKSDIEITYELPNSVSAPIKAGAEIGRAKLVKGGEVVKEVALIAGEDADGLTYWETVKEALGGWKIKKN